MNTHSVRMILLAVFSACLLMTGCADVKKTYTWAKNHVDPAPELDFEIPSDDPDMERLASYFSPIDEQIQELERILSAQDTYPNDAWFDIVLGRFPWLSGLFTVESTGEILVRHPDFSLKPVRPAGLLAHGEAWADQKLRAAVDKTEFGPEIYIGNSFFKDRNWIGLTVAHFDFRQLMEGFSETKSLMVLTDGDVLWGGSNESRAAGLLALPWKEMLKDNISGKIEMDGRSYVWFSRYLAGLNIIYALEAENAQD